MDVIAAQAFVFFLAGFETSSTTMTFCLYELACNPDIQTRLREEIDAVLSKYDGKITYEAINEIDYLDKVINGEYLTFLKSTFTHINLVFNSNVQLMIHMCCWLSLGPL